MVKIGRGIPTGPNIRATSRSAFENGLPVHTPTIELIFDFILSQFVAKKDDKEKNTQISLIMTETPLMPPYCRHEVLELLFEGYNCIERVAFVLDGPSAVPLNGPTVTTTALSIHIGATNTHIYPIINKEIDWCQVKRINWGGVSAAEFLLKILGLKYPGILNSTNPNKLTIHQAQAIWKKTAIVAADISAYEAQMDALSCSNDYLSNLNCCIRLTGDAASEAQRRQAVAEAKKAAALNQVALQEKRKILADKLRQKGEEQREAKLKSKEHIYKALQGLLERVELSLKKNNQVIKKKKSATEEAAVIDTEDQDISMDFSDDDENIEEELDSSAIDIDTNDETSSLIDVIFTPQNVGDMKLFEELRRLGFKSLNGLQEGLRRTEEDYFRLSGQATHIITVPVDFSLLNIADSELSEAEIREKRRLRLIKSSADARERQKVEKAAEDARKKAASEALEQRRQCDLEGWRVELYGQRRNIIDGLIRRQKQRADRKGATQGSRFRSVVALGESTEEPTGSGAVNGTASSVGPSDSGPDDGFGLNDDDWLVYRQVSRADEEDSDLADQETLAQIESILEERDHVHFMRTLKEEQYASLTLLDRLTFGDPGSINESDFDATSASININSERFRCTEGLFQPLSIQGIDQAGLIEVLTNLFAEYPREILADLIKNVHVTGGSAGIPGLCDRLSNELSALLPEDLVPLLNISVSSDLEASWKGIQQHPIDDFNWITRDKYFEVKPVEEHHQQPIIENNKKNKSKGKKKEPESHSNVNINEIIYIENFKNKSCSNPY